MNLIVFIVFGNSVEQIRYTKLPSITRAVKNFFSCWKKKEIKDIVKIVQVTTVAQF